MIRFIHTADWQIGKPFARVEDPEKRTLLRQERLNAIGRIGQTARDNGAAFVLVAGDLFDSTTPDKATVSAACQAIGAIGLPVMAIPGNHDHASPGSLWEQEYFIREQQALAPNLCVLKTPDPIELDGAIILPCPLRRKQEAEDTTAWLRQSGIATALSFGKPRIVLAHGSIQGFTSVSDGEEASGQANYLDISKLDPSAFDYIALGDWHGTKQVAPKAWYAGTPELDRFVKGSDHDPGNVLCIEIPARGAAPVVCRVRIAVFGWHDEAFSLVDDSSLAHLESRLDELLAGRVGKDLLRLTLSGQLGFDGDTHLREILETLGARLLRIKLENNVRVIPSDDEIAQLTQRSGDPLISALAKRLRQEMAAGPDADTARLALRELFVTVDASL